MGTDRVDAVLTQRSADDGFTKKEILEVLGRLELEDDEAVEAIYLNADSCIVFGFMRMQVCDEKLEFDVRENSPFGQEVVAVANDVRLEREDGIYEFAGVRTYMYY